VQLLEQELAANPQASRLRRQLLELHVRHGRRDEALAVVNSLPRGVEESSGREALRSAVRGACLAAVGNWISAKPYLETAYRAGCRAPLCLRWLTMTHFSQGNGEEAAAALQQWSQVDPLSPELRQARESLYQGMVGNPRQVRVDADPRSPAIAAPKLGSIPSLPTAMK